jgi:hypothetical protein
MYAGGDDEATSERRERAGVGGVSARCARLEARDPAATERKWVAGHGEDISAHY